MSLNASDLKKAADETGAVELGSNGKVLCIPWTLQNIPGRFLPHLRQVSARHFNYWPSKNVTTIFTWREHDYDIHMAGTLTLTTVTNFIKMERSITRWADSTLHQPISEA